MLRMKLSKILFFGLFFCLGSVFAQTSVQNLRVNYENTPLGTDISSPQFSWQLSAAGSKRGIAQKSYQIIVKNSRQELIWDSKRVNSSLSNGIVYQGKPLSPSTNYRWIVRVWDTDNRMISGESWFETGLMNTSENAWSGAKWIGGSEEDLVLYSPYLSVFQLSYALQLDEASHSTKASFIFGANDRRLMNKDLNLMGVQNAINESYVALELDISALEENGNGSAQLNVYRVGYDKKDSKSQVFKAIEIPKSIISFKNKYEKHTIFAICNFGMFEFYINKIAPENQLKTSDTKNTSPYAPKGLNLNPVGAGNNFISFPMLAEIGFETKENQSASFSNLEIRNYRYPSNLLFSEQLNEKYSGIFKSSTIKIEKGAYWLRGGTFVAADPSKNAAPMLRTTFRAKESEIISARLYVTARGIYELYLNGKRISNDYFNPGLTQYNKHQMYQTYDLTKDLKRGQKNALGAWLSEGWWSGNITYSGESWNFFGDRQSLLSKLVVKYADGSEQIITSNPSDWKFFGDGPIRYGSFFQGEVYDANKEVLVKDWSLANYDDSAWKSAEEVPLEGTAFVGTHTDLGGRKSSLAYGEYQLIGQIGNNASIVKTLTAQSVEEVRPKVFVYDMGQNMVGFPQIIIKNGKKGQVISIRYAEMKYPALKEYAENTGMVMMENIRAALTQDLYILKGGDEIIQPRFTFHGYRYLEMTGIEQAIAAADVKGLVISSVLGLSSSYETSNPLVNKLWSNITWSLRSNFLSIPTDTPARNERMGWSGDISVFAKSATYLTDAQSFLKRHLLAMRDVQAENGRFTDVAPMGGGFGGTLWGSAGIVVAWETYQQYGDKHLLAEHYEAMKRYMKFLESKVEPSTGILNEGPLGDWLSPEGNKNDNTLFWMAYFAYDLKVMSKIAQLLNRTEDAQYFASKANEIKQKWNEVYVDKDTHKTIKSGIKTGFMGPPNEAQKNQKSDKGTIIDTQASYAIPLDLDIFDEKNKPFAIQNLKETIKRSNKDDGGIERPEYSLMTGFIGTASISRALSENNSHTEAYKLLQQKTYPSWLYSVVNGATSIWERLNSYTVENGFGGNNSMNSFNHYSFGAVAAWMYNYSLGIQRGEGSFRHFVLKPNPDPTKEMTWAKGHYDSIYGKIASEWRYQGDNLIYLTEVPANTSATLYLPVSKIENIKESGKNLTNVSGISNVLVENNQVKMTLVSGKYSFEIKQ